MLNYLEFGVGQYGTRAIVKSTWDNSFLELLIINDVKELELNTGKGWRSETVEFLKHLTFLKSLILIDFNIKHIDSIHYLNNLSSLQLNTYSKTPINFISFPNLTNCGFEWINGSESLFNCTSLRTLGINKYNGHNSTSFSKLINIEKLTILNSGIQNLHGLRNIKKLNYLSLSNLKNLESLDGISDLIYLEELEIYKCKLIKNINDVFKLNKLKKLFLIDTGNIETLNGLEKLNDIEILMFYENTNVLDGNLNPILELKKLKKLSFQNRKHYTHKRDEFKAYNNLINL